MNYLDREGIFKVRPLDWRVKPAQSSKSVAIEIDFVVVAQLNGSEWEDWSTYDEVRVRGQYWVVGKNGQPNVGTDDKPGAVLQLVQAMDWNGSLSYVARNPAPQCIVQVTVKGEDYEGKTYYKAGWMNPENYTPQPQGAAVEEVDALDAQFGSLLRAAASSKPKAAASAPKAKAPPPKQAEPAPAAGRQDPRDAGVDYGDIPF